LGVSQASLNQGKEDMIICKVCNPIPHATHTQTADGYCAKHSTSGREYMTKPTTNQNIDPIGVSSCCQDQLIVEGDVTKYWVCRACGRACDVYVRNKRVSREFQESSSLQDKQGWEGKIYDLLYKNSTVDIVRILHEDVWPVKELSNLISQTLQEAVQAERERIMDLSYERMGNIDKDWTADQHIIVCSFLKNKEGSQV